MSNQQMASRIHNILSSKAALGMGEGEMEDLMEMYGRGVSTGGARRKKRGVSKSKTAKKRKVSSKRTTNPWILFVKRYIKDHPRMNYAEAIKSKKVRDAYYRGKKTGVRCVRKVGKTCKRGQKCVPVKGYTQKDGTKVKRTRKCIGRGYFD